MATKGNEFTIYVQLPEDDHVDIDAVVDAGLKALGIEGHMDESKWVDWYED